MELAGCAGEGDNGKLKEFFRQTRNIQESKLRELGEEHQKLGGGSNEITKEQGSREPKLLFHFEELHLEQGKSDGAVVPVSAAGCLSSLSLCCPLPRRRHLG